MSNSSNPNKGNNNSPLPIKKGQEKSQFSEKGLYVREDDQDWGSSGMNDIKQEFDINQ